MGPRPPQRPAGDPHVHFLCRTRLDAPRLETKSLSSSVLPPSYASDRLSGNNRDPALKPKRSHRKADPDAAHRYSAAVPQHRPAKQRRGLAAGRDGWEAWGRWLGAGHCPPFQCLLSGSLGLVAFSTKPWPSACGNAVCLPMPSLVLLPDTRSGGSHGTLGRKCRTRKVAEQAPASEGSLRELLELRLGGWGRCVGGAAWARGAAWAGTLGQSLGNASPTPSLTGLGSWRWTRRRTGARCCCPHTGGGAASARRTTGASPTSPRRTARRQRAAPPAR